MIVDLFLVYQFIKRLATPFKEWKAYELGIIDENGNQLKKRKEFTRREEKDAFGIFDIMIMKLKRLLEKVPGGKSRLASYAAALYLIKESEEIQKYEEDLLTEEYVEGKLDEYMSMVVNMYSDDSINHLFESAIDEDVPANSAGSGNVAGIGVGPQGEPGVSKQAQRRLQKKKKNSIIKRVLHTGVNKSGHSK